MLHELSCAAAALARTTARRARRGPARPTWSFGFEFIVEFLREDFGRTQHWLYPRLRRAMDARAYPNPEAARVTRRRAVLGGVPGEWFEPKSPRLEGALLFLHGGSYIFGSLTTHAELITRLAVATGLPTLAIEYRLAPEDPYPAALEDTLAVIRALEAEGTATPGRLLLAGDSAGGNLALVAQIARRDAGEAQAAGAVLISPWLDLTASRPSTRTNEATDYGDRPMLLRQAREFAGAVPLEDPRVSPINARLAGLAPVLVQVGSAERLFDEGVEFAQRARDAGVDATLDVLVDMPHNGPIFAQYTPEGRRAIASAGAFAARLLPARVERVARGGAARAGS